MVKMNLNAENSVKTQKNGSALSECKTEKDVLDFIQDMSLKLDNDGNIFVMESKMEMGDVEEFMVKTLENDEVLTKDVFDFAIKNIKKVNKETNIDGFEFVEFDDDVVENRAKINFLYYGSQHHHQIRKAKRKLSRMKEEYNKVFSGETSLIDYLGVE